MNRSVFKLCLGLLVICAFAVVIRFDFYFRNIGQCGFSSFQEPSLKIRNAYPAKNNVESEPKEEELPYRDETNQSGGTEKKTCTAPVSNFVFVKTHKTGGTTIRAFLDNFIENHNFTSFVAKSYPKPFHGGYPGLFRCKFLRPLRSTIVVRHSRFDANEMKRCFHPNTRYFSVLRNPWESFQSAYNFYGKHLPKKITPNCFHMPIFYIDQGKEPDVHDFLLKAAPLLNKSVPWYFRFKNYQAHDLGIDPMLTDENEIETAIRNLDENMDLMLILEHLEESLILLKELLCLDWKSLEEVHHNKQLEYTRRTEFKSAKHFQAFTDLQGIDLKLYEYFNKTLWKRVDAYGRERMAEEVKSFQEMSTQMGEKVFNQEIIKEPPSEELMQYMTENSGGCFVP